MKVSLADRLKNTARSVKGTSHPVFLEYSVKPEPRFGHGKPSHPIFRNMFRERQSAFESVTDRIFSMEDFFCDIAAAQAGDLPRFKNGWIPALDAFLLCHFVRQRKPRRYFEVGSGNSTAFVKKCITSYGLPTNMTSVAPQPRREIDNLCDVIIRSRFEDIDLEIFSTLDDGDVIFIDNSHRSFTNSDCTVFMTEVLPRLKPGLLIGIHDIFLPDDYHPLHASWYYSEQYLLACYILGGFNGFEIVYPAWHEYYYGSAGKKLWPLFEKLNLTDQDDRVRHGCSFWFETTASMRMPG